MKAKILVAVVIMAFGTIGCHDKSKSSTGTQEIDSILVKNESDMKSFVSIFEIPATDISRAVNFYQAILEINIQKIDMPDMQMGVFPYEGQMVTGVIIKAEGYQPSAEGVTIYLNGGDNLQDILDKVERNGGDIRIPKTAHANENGYFALFLDSEGNKIGLHSPN